jgi:hypothetical protein
MDDLFLLMVPTLVIFAFGMAFVLRQVVNVGGDRYQHKEYRLDEEFEKHRRKRGDGGPGQGPMSLN